MAQLKAYGYTSDCAAGSGSMVSNRPADVTFGNFQTPSKQQMSIRE
jgi:hypothetical protein